MTEGFDIEPVPFVRVDFGEKEVVQSHRLSDPRYTGSEDELLHVNYVHINRAGNLGLILVDSYHIFLFRPQSHTIGVDVLRDLRHRFDYLDGMSVSLSPLDDKFVFCGPDYRILVMRLAEIPLDKPIELCSLRGHSATVWKACFHGFKDEMIISCSMDRTLRIWTLIYSKDGRRIEYGRCAKVLRGHSDAIYTFCHVQHCDDHDQWLVSGSHDGMVKLWRCFFINDSDSMKSAKVKSECRQSIEKYGHNFVHCLCSDRTFSRVAAAYQANCVVVWTVEEGEQKGRQFKYTSKPMMKDNNNIIHLKELMILNGHSNHVLCVSFHPSIEDWLISGSLDRTVRLWSVGNGRCLRVLSSHSQCVNYVCFSGDGRYLWSAGGDGLMNTWRVTGIKSSIQTNNLTSFCHHWFPDFDPKIPSHLQLFHLIYLYFFN